MEQRGSSSHSVTWILVIALAPILYMLSIPPMAVMCGAPIKPPPEWFFIYSQPGEVLYEYSPTPAKTMVQRYAEWWLKRGMPPP